jgi:glutathione S-transferase
MAEDRKLTLFHSPNTRSSGALNLLEELGVPYNLHVINMKAGEQRRPEYLAINPMGKVPALKHGDALITEQVAIFLYLADLFPEAGLAPPIGDPLRGAYLRWLVFYAACFEPAVIDRATQRDPAPLPMSPYGDYDTMLKTLTDQLAKGRYLLGDRFTAADVLWSGALTWTTMFKLVPELPVIADYIGRCSARPAVARAKAKDAELAAAHEAEVLSAGTPARAGVLREPQYHGPQPRALDRRATARLRRHGRTARESARRTCATGHRLGRPLRCCGRHRHGPGYGRDSRRASHR